jgi:hypothetical protein
MVESIGSENTNHYRDAGGQVDVESRLEKEKESEDTHVCISSTRAAVRRYIHVMLCEQGRMHASFDGDGSFPFFFSPKEKRTL